MPKTTYRILTLFLAGTLLCGISFAQQPQPSAPSTTPPASSTTTTPKTQTAPAAKSGTTTAKKPAAPAVVLKTQKDKASYAIGMAIGKNLKEDIKKNSMDINAALLARGLRDTLAGNKTVLTEEEAKATITAYQKEVQAAAAAKNLKEGQAFLEANRDKPGVTALPSGLQYKVLQEGTGAKPTASDMVVVNYRGTLIDGTEFDSSYKRNQPATLPVGGRMIKGWTEALQLMSVGSKWQIFMPPDLAYGEQPPPRSPIGQNSALIFEVELVSIQPKPEPKPAPPAASGAPTPPAPAPGATPQPTNEAKPQTPAPTPVPAPPKPQ